jgi:DNA adenine methylase
MSWSVARRHHICKRGVLDSMKSVLKWPGAKWKIASRIVSLMPEHKIYLEPFFGSGAILFTKKPVNCEVINDLDSQVTNLFKIIRDYPEQLSRLINLTPYSREEYLLSYETTEDPFEKARRFLIRSNMARGGMQFYNSSWRHAGPVLGATTNKHVVRGWNAIPERISRATKRLKDVEIENVNALELIKKYNHPECLIYVDPPYLLSTRRQKYYNVEMVEEKEHLELLEVLKQHEGYVMISGYASDLYDEVLRSWQSVEIVSQAEQGKRRVEKIWCNFALEQQIEFDIS